jgi:hypothetical protein
LGLTPTPSPPCCWCLCHWLCVCACVSQVELVDMLSALSGVTVDAGTYNRAVMATVAAAAALSLLLLWWLASFLQPLIQV